MTQRLASWLSPTNVGRVGSPFARRPDTSQVTSAPYHIRSAVGSAAATRRSTSPFWTRPSSLATRACGSLQPLKPRGTLNQP